MKLTGNFYLENEKITFLFVVLDFGKKKIFIFNIKIKFMI